MRKPYIMIVLLLVGVIANWLARSTHTPKTQSSPSTTASAPITRIAPPETQAPPRSNTPPDEDARHAGTTKPSSSYDLDSVPANERDELRHVLAAIDAGGPFRYPKDGATFGNYERQLPQRRGGYYREYTVATAGAHNRGARRVIRGDGGETYYTNDHYRTFTRVDAAAGKD
jgi:ribonuclease T1